MRHLNQGPRRVGFYSALPIHSSKLSFPGRLRVIQRDWTQMPKPINMPAIRIHASASIGTSPEPLIAAETA